MFQWIRRIFKEFKYPYIKCKKKGHKPATLVWEGYRYSENDGIEGVKIAVKACRRCKTTLGNEVKIYCNPVESIHFQYASHANKLERTGKYIIESKWEDIEMFERYKDGANMEKK